jgi:hypothetical protein
MISLAIVFSAALAMAGLTCHQAGKEPATPPVPDRTLLQKTMKATAAGVQEPTPPQEMLVDVLPIYNLPLGINNASLRKTKRGYWLNLSVANSSNEPILGVRYWLVVVGPTNRILGTIDHSESLKLDPDSGMNVSYLAPLRLKIGDDDRVFMVVAQIIGKDSIWEVQQAKTVLVSYVKGNGYHMPTVLRMLNQVDSPLGLTPNFLRQKK